MTKTPPQAAPDKAKLKSLLDDQHQWPCSYTFKFIVEQVRLTDVTDLFPDDTPVIRPSAKGVYVSVTFSVVVDCSDTVLAVYERASKITGLISL